MSTDRTPRALRALKIEIIAVARLVENDAYCTMTRAEFVGAFIRETGGNANPRRAHQWYEELMRDAGLPPLERAQ